MPIWQLAGTIPGPSKFFRAVLSSARGHLDACFVVQDNVEPMWSISATEHRLKGDRNAREEIWAEGSGAAFGERMRSYIRCLRLHRTCASTAAVRTYRSNTDAADTIADPQSIQSFYCASTELPADHAYNAKHNAFNTKHRSKC